MTLAKRPDHLPKKQKDLTVLPGGRVMGTEILGIRGSGKTLLTADLAFQGLRKGLPQVIFDGLGTLTPALLFRLSRFLRRVPPAFHSRFWDRLIYVPIGSKERVVPFPVYYGLQEGDSLAEIAERYLHAIHLSNPALVSQAPVSLPAMEKIGVYTGIVLACLGLQLSEARSLLFRTVDWEHSGRFDEALSRCPEAAEAVSYFRETYLPLSRAGKSQETALFLNHVFRLTVNPTLRALFCASTPGIAWQTVEEQGLTVILDFRNVLSDETKRFAMLWIFLTLFEFLKQRGRKETPFVVTIDEFAALTQQVTAGVNPLAALLDEFINQYMRNNNIWLTIAHQSLFQLDEHLRNTVLSLGNMVIGKVATMEEARLLADVLFYNDPYRVKRYHNVWGKADMPPMKPGKISLTNEDSGYFVLERVPEYMELSEQLELFAQQLCQQHLFEFLLRPAIREGEVSQSVIPISIADYLRDTANGELQFPDQARVSRYREELAARSGIPVATILKEQEQRLITGTPREQQEVSRQQVTKVAPLAAPDVADGNGSKPSSEQQPVRGENGEHPELHTERETQSHPTLDEQQQAFLTFLINHPAIPIAEVSKGLKMRAVTATEIRESLKTQGLIHELEVRPTGTGAGRPLKWLLPTMQAFELFGIDPPTGRGGVIHRQLQQLIAQSATDKGYTAYCEKTLATGAIVDVHLERGGEHIAVEIAIMSHPSRELAHIRQCLSADYDKIFTVFADSQLLERTREALGVVFSDAERSRVQLVPVSTLTGIG